MKRTAIIMGMPITVEIVGRPVARHIADVFGHFRRVDVQYSTYKLDSEISQINRGLPRAQWSDEMCAVLAQCEATKQETHGFFDIAHADRLDPSGLVKGWAIQCAADMLVDRGVQNFYIEAGGDIQAHGCAIGGQPWSVGIRNPFDPREIIKVVQLHDAAIATSGQYIRGVHIYNPQGDMGDNPLRSVSVIAPRIYDADRFATAAFAMGLQGIDFIESRSGLEGYVVTDDRVATLTTGFGRYVVHA